MVMPTTALPKQGLHGPALPTTLNWVRERFRSDYAFSVIWGMLGLRPHVAMTEAVLHSMSLGWSVRCFCGFQTGGVDCALLQSLPGPSLQHKSLGNRFFNVSSIFHPFHWLARPASTLHPGNLCNMVAVATPRALCHWSMAAVLLLPFNGGFLQEQDLKVNKSSGLNRQPPAVSDRLLAIGPQLPTVNRPPFDGC